MHGLRESAMAPFNEGHLLSGGGIGVGYPVFIEINEHYRYSDSHHGHMEMSRNSATNRCQ